MATLHTKEVIIPYPKLNFLSYNPRVPLPDAVQEMLQKMKIAYESDVHHLIVAVSQASIKNLTQLPHEYSPHNYARIPYAEFDPSSVVFFLTGGTRNAASKRVFESFGPTKQKKVKQAVNSDGTPNCS